VKGLLNGYIPLGGGLISHLLALKKDGVTVSLSIFRFFSVDCNIVLL